jgi:hypothetical protein
VILAEANKEGVSEITHLAGEITTFMEETLEELLTKTNIYHTLDPLEKNMI